jgi:hypothetical protein
LFFFSGWLSAQVIKIAEKRGVDPATIIVSWLIGRGIVVLPKSVTPKRISSNFQDVVLDKEEIEELNTEAREKVPRARACDQSESFDWDSAFCYFSGWFGLLFLVFEDKHPENNDAAQAKLG